MRPDGKVLRLDFSQLGSTQTTAQGFLKCDAALGRVGVVAYHTSKGARRELRPPDEVFSPLSMETAADAVVTDMHPDPQKAWITTKNYREFSVGHVSGSVRQDGQLLRGSLIITDPEMIGKIANGQRKGISPGYLARMEETPGRWNAATGEYGPHVLDGEPYDAIQRDIVHNSIGLGPPGWGYQGTTVALKLDGNDGVAFGEPEPPLPASGKTKVGGRMEGIEFKLDGVAITVSQAARDVIERALRERDGKLAESATALAGEQAKSTALQARYDGLVEKYGKLEIELKEAPERARSQIQARLTLEDQARRVLGTDFKLDGLTARQVHEAVLAKLSPELKLDGRSDLYVQTRFEVGVEDFRGPTAAELALGALSLKGGDGNPSQRLDGQDDDADPDVARKKLAERNDKAWQVPAAR